MTVMSNITEHHSSKQVEESINHVALLLELINNKDRVAKFVDNIKVQLKTLADERMRSAKQYKDIDQAQGDLHDKQVHLDGLAKSLEAKETQLATKKATLETDKRSFTNEKGIWDGKQADQAQALNDRAVELKSREVYVENLKRDTLLKEQASHKEMEKAQALMTKANATLKKMQDVVG